ncbi:MAG: terminase small subunit [Blautia sp.]|uniref:terminase small subunit n=1 Tax=Blautia sp. TaxID=1955243 RepID=UPI002E78E48D|nr:terminase small subunit [Blautia sp.]MEE1444841.1 terminase small subunit [Blautia sp.]
MDGEVKATNAELAYQDYLKGMKYKEIAEKYGVTINTVKSWKTRYKWSKDGKKSVHTKTGKVCTQKSDKNNVKKEAIAEEVEQVIENAELTDKQRFFCLYYVKCFNATKAYQKAFQVDYATACGNASNLLKSIEIKNEILRLKQNRLNREMLDESDIFQKYMDIAFSDVTDFVEFGQEDVPVMAVYGPVQVKDEETGEKKTLTKRVNVVRFKDSSEVDGTLIAEVKQGKDGASIKLPDRMKALEWLTEHMDMATKEQQIRIRRAEFAMNQELGNHDEDNENIASFLKAMSPEQENINELFQKEEEDAEEKEETGEI